MFEVSVCAAQQGPMTARVVQRRAGASAAAATGGEVANREGASAIERAGKSRRAVAHPPVLVDIDMWASRQLPIITKQNRFLLLFSLTRFVKVLATIVSTNNFIIKID